MEKTIKIHYEAAKSGSYIVVHADDFAGCTTEEEVLALVQEMVDEDARMNVCCYPTSDGESAMVDLWKSTQPVAGEVDE